MPPLTRQSACMALLLLLTPASADARKEEDMRNDNRTAERPHGSPGAPGDGNPRGTALGPANTIGDILTHPAFAGFARRVLPWDDRSYDEGLPLGALGSLLPYHSHVDVAAAINGLNRLIADVASGGTVFYDLHTEAQKRAQPAKEHTGLFFFRGRPGAPSRSSHPAVGSPMSGRFTKAFPTRSTSATGATTPSFSNIALGTAVGRQPRTWRPPSPSSFGMRQR